MRGAARARLGGVTPLGAASIAAYLGALVVIEATGEPNWRSLACSPDAVAHGRLWLLVSSGLDIDDLPWAQLTVLALILAVALWRLGAARLWTVALVAHVGAALIAYAAIGVLWLIDRSTVAATVVEPDYGISVVLAGELGALAASGGRRTALPIGVAALIGFGIGVADASALANAEHLLGFALGAVTLVCLDRHVPRRSR